MTSSETAIDKETESSIAKTGRSGKHDAPAVEDSEESPQPASLTTKVSQKNSSKSQQIPADRRQTGYKFCEPQAKKQENPSMAQAKIEPPNPVSHEPFKPNERPAPKMGLGHSQPGTVIADATREHRPLGNTATMEGQMPHQPRPSNAALANPGTTTNTTSQIAVNTEHSTTTANPVMTQAIPQQVPQTAQKAHNVVQHNNSATAGLPVAVGGQALQMRHAKPAVAQVKMGPPNPPPQSFNQKGGAALGAMMWSAATGQPLGFPNALWAKHAVSAAASALGQSVTHAAVPPPATAAFTLNNNNTYEVLKEAIEKNAAPTYVNAKQYERIMIRRSTRAILEAHYKKQVLLRNNANEKRYRYESRHLHSHARPRNKKGRYLRKEQLEEYYRLNPDKDPKNCKTSNGETTDQPTSSGNAPNHPADRDTGTSPVSQRRTV